MTGDTIPVPPNQGEHPRHPLQRATEIANEQVAKPGHADITLPSMGSGVRKNSTPTPEEVKLQPLFMDGGDGGHLGHMLQSMTGRPCLSHYPLRYEDADIL